MSISSRYHEIRKLGQGGMGEVWLVYDRELASNFAMKRLLPELVRKKDLERFEREIYNLKKINHQNIVRITDFDIKSINPFYVMEYCSSGSIETQLIHTKGNSSSVEAIFRQMMNAINYLQCASPPILHRDIKPSNILQGDDGNLKLADFGLSISRDDATVTSSNWFSHGFTAPEQYENMHEVDARADIYSVAAVAYYLYTGKYPDRSNYTALYQHTNPVIGNLHLLLEPSRADRPFTAKEVLLGIDQVLFVADSAGVYSTSQDIARCPECGSWAIESCETNPRGSTYQITCLVCGIAQPSRAEPIDHPGWR